MAGDVGFDPLGLSNIDDVGIDLYWLREAELKHGRIAMLACAGVFWVEIFGSFPGMVRSDILLFRSHNRCPNSQYYFSAYAIAVASDTASPVY